MIILFTCNVFFFFVGYWNNKLEKNIRHTLFFRIVQYAVFFLFLGRALQHFFSSTPYRNFFWDEELFSKQDWNYHTQILFNDSNLDLLAYFIGVIFLFAAITTIFIFSLKKRRIKFAFILGVIFLTFLFFIGFKDNFYRIGQLMEMVLQGASPLFLYFIAFSNTFTKKIDVWMRGAIACTFIGHGLFALGYYPIPISFFEMSISILGWDEETIRTFLRMAGVMDFLVAILLFLPHKFRQSGLLYAFLWGLLTTLARITSYLWVNDGFSLSEFLYHLPGTIYRIPHCLIPLALFIYYSDASTK